MPVSETFILLSIRSSYGTYGARSGLRRNRDTIAKVERENS